LAPVKPKGRSEIRLGFFELLFGTDHGYLCIATTDPKVPKTSFTQKFFEWPREAIKTENFILSNQVKKNVYFCINLLSKRERLKKNCLPTNLVWAELDEVNPDDIEGIPPPIVIRSSPGKWQAIWRMTTSLDPYDAERYSRRMTYYVGADKSGWDLGQLFRVPYTQNYKYDTSPEIVLERALETKAEAAIFEKAVPAPPEETANLGLAVPSSEVLVTPEEIIAKYQYRLDLAKFTAWYSYEPAEDEDWSKILWTLEVNCFRAGMSAEEVFVLAKTAACNKFARDGRPIEHLWKDVLKAGEAFGNVTPEKELLTMPKLVDEPTADGDFIADYKDWACEATDAVSEFHELSAMVMLSAIVAASVRLETSYGNIAPNLWGLVLGDSTVTRKSTSMKMAVDLLSSLEPELILATDGSVEGLLSGMANRPNKVSVFFRDEVSGLFDSINKRDYLSSMPETLAHLYDVPPIYSRLLRKEVIRIESPAFVFFGGGITERVYQCVTEDWIESGFMPRFLIVGGDFDQGGMRPTGPPTELGISKRAAIQSRLADFYEHYAAEVPTKIGPEQMFMPPRIMADLTVDAWKRYQDIESQLTISGYESLVRNTALPTFDRMARSILKMGMILACTRQVPDATNHIKVEESDIINAAWYAQKWGQHSVDLILNAGKAPREKYIDRVYKKILNNPGILRGTLMQHLHLTKREADDILGTLEERGQVRSEKAGRGRTYWSL
jgi:Protein of unknown function (DUF3987)